MVDLLQSLQHAGAANPSQSTLCRRRLFPLSLLFSAAPHRRAAVHLWSATAICSHRAQLIQANETSAAAPSVDRRLSAVINCAQPIQSPASTLCPVQPRSRCNFVLPIQRRHPSTELPSISASLTLLLSVCAAKRKENCKEKLRRSSTGWCYDMLKYSINLKKPYR